MSKIYLVWREHPIGDFFLLKAFIDKQKAEDLVSKLQSESKIEDDDYYVSMMEVEE